MRCLMAVGVAVALCSTACTRGPKGLSGPGYFAAQKAIDAINRAYEYREQGAVYYEPRFLDAQRSVSEIPATDDASPEGQFKVEAKTCVSILEIYRLRLETNALKSQNRGTKAEAAMADYELKQASYEAAKCVRDLPAVLKRLAPAGK